RAIPYDRLSAGVRPDYRQTAMLASMVPLHSPRCDSDAYPAYRGHSYSFWPLRGHHSSESKVEAMIRLVKEYWQRQREKLEAKWYQDGYRWATEEVLQL